MPGQIIFFSVNQRIAYLQAVSERELIQEVLPNVVYFFLLQQQITHEVDHEWKHYRKNLNHHQD
jgi:Na+-translocating ferredoxin:NAD+ oxidoreductase RnfG subunit